MSWPLLRSVLALGSWPGAATASTALPRGVEVSTAALLGVVGLAVALALALGWTLGRRTPGPKTAPAPAPAPPAARPPRSEAAIPPAGLDLVDQPLLVLSGPGEGDVLEQFNTAAAARHPALRVGQPARALLEALAPGLVPAADEPGRRSGQAGAWRWMRVDATPRLWVLESGDDAAERLAYTLSHDLRAPLRSVDGFARIVKEDYGPQLDRVANDHLDRILGAAGRMNAMIDAMLSLARLSAQPLQREPVNLSQLAGFVVEDLRRQHPEQPVQATVAPDLSAQGDPTLLRVVLENLLGNAWKYSSRNPGARIAFERVEHQGRPAFVVRDNGAGFDMRAAGRLFGLFQRLHGASEFPGHGLGLASVRRIVQRHGGRVWAESEPGRGARFYFTLGG